MADKSVNRCSMSMFFFFTCFLGGGGWLIIVCLPGEMAEHRKNNKRTPLRFEQQFFFVVFGLWLSIPLPCKLQELPKIRLAYNWHTCSCKTQALLGGCSPRVQGTLTCFQTLRSSLATEYLAVYSLRLFEYGRLCQYVEPHCSKTLACCATFALRGQNSEC